MKRDMKATAFAHEDVYWRVPYRRQASQSDAI